MSFKLGFSSKKRPEKRILDFARRSHESKFTSVFFVID